jgi:transcriptional regulator GlxA family with amidase domain
VTRRRVGILVFPEVEVLDFCGPFEVFSVTRLDEERRRQDPSPYEVLIIAQHSSVVVATGGLKVVPEHSLEDCPPLDVLVVPGGWGTRREMMNERLIAWLGETARQVTTLTSVCTGSLLLCKAGLLDGKRATTHWRVLEEMRGLFPAVNVIDDQHVVEEGDLLTSAGISAGIDMTLRVVARHHGDAVARATARYMEYPFPEDNRRRV